MNLLIIGWVILRIMVMAALGVGLYKLIFFVRGRLIKQNESKAIGTLKEKFAKGEVDQADYKKRLELLQE